jgi:hypothetical protein
MSVMDLQLRGLCKRFGEVKAVADADLAIHPGKVLAQRPAGGHYLAAGGDAVRHRHGNFWQCVDRMSVPP